VGPRKRLPIADIFMEIPACGSSCDGFGFDAAQLTVLIHEAFVLARSQSETTSQGCFQ
jgi:hypothetical protein